VPDLRAPVRVVDELLWSLRREGFVVSTAQAIDAIRCVAAVGFERRDRLREAIAAVVVQRRAERPRFDLAFDAFFGDPDARATLWERLARQGVTAEELDGLRAVLKQMAGAETEGLAALGTLLEGGAEFDRVLSLAGITRGIDAHAGPQLGFLTHRAHARVGLHGARRNLALFRAQLAGALGDRGAELADLLAAELERREEDLGRHLRRAFDARVAEAERARDPGSRRLETTPFAALTDAEVEDVRRAVRALAERLRGGARVRARHALRGRVDAHATLRRAMRTGGVPFAPVRRRKSRQRPRLVLLCDVSDSVRAAAAFLLEFTHAVHELFDRVRSFVFVSELGETTDLFEREPVRVAIARAWGGGIVRAGDNSNYGRVLRAFEEKHLRELDRRTTVVVLGDGRTNFHDPSPEVLDRIRVRSRALLWLCPEPRGQWAQGDSAMPLYAPRCTSVHEVRTAADLDRAARSLVLRR
jgi:uncharacterized protein with von Willebrand factor type A (vWA) domain